jgi:hypothetical protein
MFCNWHTFVHEQGQLVNCPIENSPMCYCRSCPFCGARDPFKEGATTRTFYRQYCLSPLRRPIEFTDFLHRHNALYISPLMHSIRVIAPFPHWTPGVPFFGKYKRRFMVTPAESTGECILEE